MNRREFLTASVGAALLPGLGRSAFAAPAPALLKGKAEHVISIWLGGGMGQIDTFDPKRRGDPKKKSPAPTTTAIPTASAGVSVCEHLKLTGSAHGSRDGGAHRASRRDRRTRRRLQPHAHRPRVSGTIVYPSLGSIIAHERRAAIDGVPPYVLIGYPNVTRGRVSSARATVTFTSPTRAKGRPDFRGRSIDRS
jgi:hypothetical protein